MRMMGCIGDRDSLMNLEPDNEKKGIRSLYSTWRKATAHGADRLKVALLTVDGVDFPLSKLKPT